jgi:MotA/TolQ/ExbB proton channel family
LLAATPAPCHNEGIHVPRSGNQQVRRILIQVVLPVFFCVLPLLAAGLVAVCVPREALLFFWEHVGAMEELILGLGTLLFVLQMAFCWKALRWQGTGFDEGSDRWVSNLAQAAEWFPMLGLIGTVAGILLTFSSIHANTPQLEIIRHYAPAITATGAGLFMALINMMPSWMILLGRDVIASLGGGAPRPPQETP